MELLWTTSSNHLADNDRRDFRKSGFQLIMELVVTPRCLKNAKQGASRIGAPGFAERASGDLKNDLYGSLHDALITGRGDLAKSS